MFLLYHSEGCNTDGTVFHWCYVNDLSTTTCSGMLGHRKLPCSYCRNPDGPCTVKTRDFSVCIFLFSKLSKYKSRKNKSNKLTTLDLPLLRMAGYRILTTWVLGLGNWFPSTPSLGFHHG